MSVNLKDLWPCRSGLCRGVKERRSGAARRDERRDGRVHHQGRAARRRELWLRRRDQEENEWLGQPTAGVQPLGGKNPNPTPAFSPTDVLPMDDTENSKQRSLCHLASRWLCSARGTGESRWSLSIQIV